MNFTFYPHELIFTIWSQEPTVIVYKCVYEPCSCSSLHHERFTVKGQSRDFRGGSSFSVSHARDPWKPHGPRWLLDGLKSRRVAPYPPSICVGTAVHRQPCLADVPAINTRVSEWRLCVGHLTSSMSSYTRPCDAYPFIIYRHMWTRSTLQNKPFQPSSMLCVWGLIPIHQITSNQNPEEIHKKLPLKLLFYLWWVSLRFLLWNVHISVWFWTW